MRFKFSPLESRGVLMGFSLGRLVMLVAALASGVLAVRAGSWPVRVLLLVVIAFLLVVGLVRVGGRSLTSWLPVAAAYLVQRSVRQHVYRGGRFGVNSVEDHMDLPGVLAAYQWLPARALDGQREIGLLKEGGEVVAVLACSGTNVVLEDSTLQTRRIVDWGDVMRALGGNADGVIRWQVMERTVPDGAGAAQAFVRTRMLASQEGSVAAASIRQLVEHAAPSALRHEVYLAVRFDLGQLGPQIKDAGDTAAAAAAVVVDALYSIEGGITDAGITSQGWLSPRDLAAVLRTQFDPVDIAHLETRTPDDGGALPGVAPQLAGPTAAEAHWAAYRHDSGWSRTLWVHALPVRDVERHWLLPLLNQTPCRRTVSLVAQPLSNAKADALARRQMVQHEGDRRTRQKLNLVESARVRKEAHGVQQEDEEVAAGFARLRYSMFVTITAGDPAELERDVMLVRRQLSKAGCESSILFGEQDQAFVAGALPVAYGLSPMRGIL